MSRKHLIENWQFAQLRTRLADQLAQFHPQLRQTLLRNLSELVAAITLARNVQLSAIGAKLPVALSEEARQQWVRRQLCNDTEDTLQLFRPLAASWLASLGGVCG
jgi:putative SOS response-associated peptidase YedK